MSHDEEAKKVCIFYITDRLVLSLGSYSFANISLVLYIRGRKDSSIKGREKKMIVQKTIVRRMMVQAFIVSIRLTKVKR